MRIGAIQKTTLIDYPGKLACTIFTQGCNFRCPYCHNPELLDEDFWLDSISIKDILDFLKKRWGKLEGVCITGGEPTLHTDLPEFIEAVKGLNYAVKLDTQGSIPGMLERLLGRGLLDYVAMDIKCPLEKYQVVTNSVVRPESIQRSVDLLKSSPIPHEFRTTVVKSLLDKGDFEKIGELIVDAPVYYLQKFVPTKTYCEELLNETTYSDHELMEIKRTMERYVRKVEIR